MKNVAAGFRRSAFRSVWAAFAVCLCCLGSACRQTDAPVEEKKVGLQEPLTSFRQVLTSSRTGLNLQPGQDTKIPVRIQNPGTESWVSAGQYPVTVSYKWYKDGEMMRIEGERTTLPSPIGPNQAVDADVRVIAPTDPGKYAIRFTLVQEGVAWYLLMSDAF